MASHIPPLGILQGRLTPSPDGSIQFFPEDGWQNEFPTARQIGFDCAELLVKKNKWQENPLMSDSGRTQIYRLAQQHKIFIRSVHGFYERQEKYPVALKSIVINASSLGARTVLVSFFGENALISDEDKLLARSNLLEALNLCSTFQVKIGVETEMPAMELLDFIESFKHPNIGIYYDIGNMASMGVNVAEEIRLLGDKICGVHVKDRLANGGETVPLGEGCADFEAAFRALRDVGYGGPFIIQGARVSSVDDVELNRRYYRFCKNLLEKTYGGGEQ